MRDAGGTVVRVRARQRPARHDGGRGRAATRPALRRFVGPDHARGLGSALGTEFAAGGKTPLWDALGDDHRAGARGRPTPPADAIVVVRSASRSRADEGIPRRPLRRPRARRDVPAVGTRRPAVAERVPRVRRSPASRPSTRSTPRRAGWRSCCCSRGAEPGSYGVGDTANDGVLPPIPPTPASEAVTERLTVLVAARDEEERIGADGRGLRAQLPDAAIVVADDGSRDETAARRRGRPARR